MTNDLLCSAASIEKISPHGNELQPNASDTLPWPIKTVLLVEDDASDIFMVKMACERAGVAQLLQIVTDGEMAIDYLSGKGAYADRTAFPLPSLIFLDIHIPKQSGFDILKLVRAKPGLKKIPVIMLSSSTLPVDVDRAYQFGVTSYVQKIPNQTEFCQAIRVVLNYWLKLNAPVS
jgi:CheY-like chemotaxis protein